MLVCDPPLGRRDILEAAGNPGVWMAHQLCAKVVPETWVDDVEGSNGVKVTQVFGVDGIVKDRWNLVSVGCGRLNRIHVSDLILRNVPRARGTD